MKKSELIFSALLVPIDFLMVVLAGLSAYFLRFSGFVQEIRPVVFDLPLHEFFPVLLGVAFSWLFIFAFTGLYVIKPRQRFIDELYKIFTACSVGVMLVLAVIFFRRELFDSRFIVLLGWILSIVFVFGGRFLVRSFQKSLFQKKIGVHRVLLVGDDLALEGIAKIFQKDKRLGYEIVGRIPSQEDILEKVKKEAELKKVDEIIVGPGISRETARYLVDFCNERHIVYKYIPNLFETQAINVEVVDLGGIPIIELKRTPLDGWKKILKRGVDVAGSLVAIVVFAPLMLIIALFIKLDSPGPVFFGYYRIGQHGKPFFYFKFRSMIKDAHKMRYDPEFRKKVEDLRGWNEENPMIKYKNDPRITRVGRFLRRYSLDELPEFFNVLIGKMSLVGPRPHEPEEVAKYKKDYKKILTIKPGITGLAQISGRSDLSFAEEAKLDIYYIENWSLKLDLYIILKTPLALFRKRQAE